MHVDLGVTFLGVRFKNPFLLAPSPATRTCVLDRAARAGWGGAVTSCAEIINEHSESLAASLPHEIEYIDRPPAYWTFQMVHHFGDVRSSAWFQPGGDLMSVERVEKVVRKAKESGMPIIANIIGNLDPDTWVRPAMAAEKAGADILELNPSHARSPKVGMHLGFASDPAKTRQIVKAVREKTSIPIMVKLSAFLIAEQLKNWAKACVEGGADAISLTNSIPGFTGVDIETGIPNTATIDVNGKLRGSAYQLCDGPGIRPMTMAGVAIVDWVVDVPVVAAGGVSDWYSAVEYFMLGANMVGVGSAAVVYGYGMIRDLTQGLERFMVRKGYKSIEEFVGITNKKYFVGEQYPRYAPGKAQRRKMIVDEVKCNGCGRCVVTCETGAFGAVKIIDGIAKINQDACVKCNLCMLVCPERAISTQWESGVIQV